PSHQPPKTRECIGWTIRFPAGKSPHTSYPFTLHTEYSLPWGYEFSEGNFILRASGCLRRLKDEEILCNPCVVVSSNTILAGIYARIRDGVDENSRLCFHPIENLIEINRRRTEQVRHQALLKLNDTRTIMRKMETIDNQKELIMAVASGKVMR
ncbi:hypothetical protein B0H14DRAFT_2182183, partial [Mycena olivaceomarginata]